MNKKPKTELGKRLISIRKEAIQKGTQLMNEEEILKEIAQRSSRIDPKTKKSTLAHLENALKNISSAYESAKNESTRIVLGMCIRTVNELIKTWKEKRTRSDNALCQDSPINGQDSSGRQSL